MCSDPIDFSQLPVHIRNLILGWPEPDHDRATRQAQALSAACSYIQSLPEGEIEPPPEDNWIPDLSESAPGYWLTLAPQGMIGRPDPCSCDEPTR